MASVQRRNPKRRRATPRPDPIAAVRAYIQRINTHDPAGLAALAVPRPKFVDAAGERFVLSREAWASYFALFPDYRIHVDRIFSRGGSVAIFGTARGSYHGRGRRSSQSAWRIRAAWLAVVRAGKIAEWRVYADIEPMRKSAGLDRS